MLQGRSASLFSLLSAVHAAAPAVLATATTRVAQPKRASKCIRLVCKCCVIVTLLLLLSACSLSADYAGAPAGFAEPTAISNAKDHLSAKWQNKLSQSRPSNSVIPSVWGDITESAQSNRPAAPDSSFNQELNRDLAVTIDVNELPASQILEQLALETGIDILVSSIADQAVTLRLSRRPFSDSLDILADQLDAGWRFENGAVHLFADQPVVVSYPVHYLNIVRDSASSVGLATQVGSITLDADNTSFSGGGSNNSETKIKNEASHNLWYSLRENLDALATSDDGRDAKILINQEAGLVTIVARHKFQKTVREYLQALHNSIGRQVLIEATVIEVNLSNEHRRGIDWSLFNPSADSDGNGVSWSQRFHGLEFPASPDAGGPSPSALLQVRKKGTFLGDLTATIELLQTYGDVQILSQPQIIALNNQPAVLKVVDNRVYFSVEVERSNNADFENITSETRIHTVPVGLVMSVIPFVTSEGRVVLNIRPSISRILGFRESPISQAGTDGIRNSVPEIQVREMESVLSVNNGETAVIGGLMQQTQGFDDSGVSGLRSVPVLGKLFGQSNRTRTKTELLVFLKPTVL